MTWYSFIPAAIMRQTLEILMRFKWVGRTAITRRDMLIFIRSMSSISLTSTLIPFSLGVELRARVIDCAFIHVSISVRRASKHECVYSRPEKFFGGL